MDQVKLVDIGPHFSDTSLLTSTDQIILQAHDTEWHVKYPLPYISANWPIRFHALSTDGKLLAIAGKDGLAHYSFHSGRWKLFEDLREEASFSVRGGMAWFHHILIVGAETDESHEVRMSELKQAFNRADTSRRFASIHATPSLPTSTASSVRHSHIPSYIFPSIKTPYSSTPQTTHFIILSFPRPATVSDCILVEASVCVTW